MGRLIQKIQCHPIACTTAPPTNGPTAPLTPPAPLQMPIAHARRPGGYAPVTRVRVSGTMIAAPAPCIARAATNTPIVGADPASKDAPTNVARPVQSIRRRPKRSPSAAPVNSRQANERL